MKEREMVIPVGPQHPALKEPEYLNFKVEGEKVVDADIRIGYIHRGIQKAMEARNYIQNIYLSERVCGICSYVHTTTYCQAVEKLLDVEIPKRAEYIRTVVLELERLHSHLLWLGIAGHEVGFDTFLMYTWRDRELVMDLLEMISGNRVNYAMNTIGGVRRDISDELKSKILKGMDVIEERTKYYLDVAGHEPTFLKRAQGAGYIDAATLRKLCAVGPTARGSGVKRDVRRDDPYAAYDEIPFEVVTSDLGDVLGRTVVRALEIIESCKIIRYALKHMPSGEIRVRVKRKAPLGEALSRCEAQRGEVFYYIRGNGTEKPERVMIRTPTLANITASIEMLKGGYIADIPIVFAAIDPCMACMDRALMLNEEGEAEIWDWERLRNYGIDWYEGRA